jgi:hypothetical protein
MPSSSGNYSALGSSGLTLTAYFAPRASANIATKIPMTNGAKSKVDIIGRLSTLRSQTGHTAGFADPASSGCRSSSIGPFVVQGGALGIRALESARRVNE